MTALAGVWSAVWAGVRFLLRQVLWAAAAAVLVVVACAFLLCLSWLATDPEAALPDVPYAWLGMVGLGMAFGLPVSVVFGLSVAPLAVWLGRVHAGLAWVVSAAGGAVWVTLMATPRVAWLGALGGVTYAALERRTRRPRARITAP